MALLPAIRQGRDDDFHERGLEPMIANLLTATEAAQRMARGELTSLELVESCLARIAAREPDVKAFAHIDPDHARVQARAADAARRAGQGVGLLHGLPVGIKDIIDTADMPTENGCAADKGRRPDKDAFVVATLRAAGAVILGKTVTTELATLTPPPTRNPRNLAHTPGGSSSGSAAAVADGMLPLALGTQTGGSVIRPASFCGIHALKPTLGLISRRGVTMQSHTLDTVGVYGRSIDDLALIAEALAVPDPDDPVSIASAGIPFRAIAAGEPPVAPTFVFVKPPGWETAAEAVAKEAIGELVAMLGERCVSIDTPTFAYATEAHRTVNAAENAHYYGPLLEHCPEGLTEQLKERLRAGAKIDAKSYLDALAKRAKGYAIVEELCTSYSAIVTLSAPGRAPADGTTGNPIFNGLWTFLGVPCVSLPLLEADGLPIGVQLVGLRRDDARLLRTARWLEKFAAENA